MDRYEYGIVHIRSLQLHRSNLAQWEAEAFIHPSGWDGVDPTKLFKIVRRKLGAWKDLS